MHIKIKKKYVITLLVLILITIVSIPCFVEKQTEDDIESPLLDTMLNYSIVSHTLMGDKGLSKELFGMSARARYNLFRLWRFKINKECLYNKELTDFVSELNMSGINFSKKGDVDKYKKRSDEFYNNCAQDYIHRNWESINETILNTYKRNKKEKCPYCLFYRLFY